MRDLFINHVSGFLIWLVKFLPFSLLKYLINILAILLAIMLKRFRVIAKKNYTFVYDRKPEIYKGFTITYGIYKLLGMQAVDVLTFIDGKYPRNNFIDNVYGLSYLNEAINKCNGIIIISAHIGNFTLLNLLLKELGYTDCAMIMRSVKNKKIEEKLNNIKQKAQINFFNESYIKKNILMLATFLRKKGILILITDQRHLKGVPLEFFGKTKMSPPGPATLSILTGAPIVPFFAMRAKDGGSNIIIKKPVYTDNLTLTDNNIENITLSINKILEEFIKENFNQWFCFHQWWK